jgi:hypothetical protein
MTTEIAGFDINFFPIIKAGLEIFLILYAIIAFVVIKQIDLMTRTIKSEFNKILYILAYMHLFIVLIVLVITFFAL